VTAHATSHCPVTGRTISLLVTPEEMFDLNPPEAQISLVVDGEVECCHHMREEVCNDGHFFHSREAALHWQATHLHALILSVQEAYQVGKLAEDFLAEMREGTG
jgi:alkylmercury lyase